MKKDKKSKLQEKIKQTVMKMRNVYMDYGDYF